jgi:hypothetical protein
VVEGSKLYQVLYRHVLPPGVAFDDTRSMPRSWKWSDEKLDFQGKRLGDPEASISAHGVEAATTGGHWPKLILDDLIEKRHQLSDSEMERVRAWVKNHIYLMRPSEKGMAYVNCTPWTYHDVYTDLLRDYGYKVYRRSALETPDGDPDIVRGESIFPEKLDTKTLKVMYHRDEEQFWSQMMCIPKPGKDRSFDVNWIRHCRCNPELDEPLVRIEPASYDPLIGQEENPRDGEMPPDSVPLHMLTRGLFFDPVSAKLIDRKREPYSRHALLMRGVDPWDRQYYLESWAGRAEYATMIDRIMEMMDRWACIDLYCEEVAAQDFWEHWIRRETSYGGKYADRTVQVFPCKPGKMHKDDRIMARASWHQRGLCYINRMNNSAPGAGYCEQFVQEMLEYPHGLTRDIMDADGYSEKLLRPETPTEYYANLQRSQRRTHPHGTQDRVTGY